MTHALSSRWWVLGAISLAILAVTMDVTVLNLALPTLAHALQAPESALQWFIAAYTLALTAMMLPAGLIGDRYGRKRLMVGALGLFAVGSVACAYAPGPALFLVARIAVGVAGAALTVVALSLITLLFDEFERPRAIGIWSSVTFLGLPLGPIIGGLILSHLWWGWIFLMNVPVALVALGTVVALVPESRAAHRPHIDGLGLLLSSLGLVGIMYGIIHAGNRGWDNGIVAGSLALGLAALVSFGFWERAVGRGGRLPLIDMHLFGSRSFTWGVILTALAAIGLFGAMFVLPQYYEAIAGFTPVHTGLLLLPLVGGLVVGASPADRVAARMGAKWTVAVGLAVIALACWWGASLTVHTSATTISLWTFGIGVGAGLTFATAASAAIVELSAERSGVGSAVLQALVKLGPALGAAILGSILITSYQHHVDVSGVAASLVAAVKSSVYDGSAIAHQTHSAHLLTSVHAAFVVGIYHALQLTAAIAGVSALVAVALLPSRPHRARVEA